MRYIYSGLSLFCFIMGIAGIVAFVGSNADVITASALALTGIAGAYIFNRFARRLKTS